MANEPKDSTRNDVNLEAAATKECTVTASGELYDDLTSSRDQASLAVAASHQPIPNALAEATKISTETQEISSKDIDTESEGKYKLRRSL